MVIRISIILCLLTQISFSQGIEMQRKYSPSRINYFTEFIRNSGSAGEFKTHYHSDYITTDIYFDTPEKDLFTKGLSMRFRRRMISEDSSVYTFQIKTEMITGDGIRTEVDEPELDFYQVILKDYQSTLPQLLDSLFYYCENTNSRTADSKQKYTALLSAWMKQKSGAPIAPFQKLKFLFPETFTEEKTGSFMPVCMGHSTRLRSHIYIDLKNYSNQFGRLFKNPNAVKDKLDFFEKNDSYIWVMESSLDSSLFISLTNQSTKPYAISEFEMEAKYQQDSIAFRMIDALEKILIEKYELVKTMDSKYRQSMLSFGY